MFEDKESIVEYIKALALMLDGTDENTAVIVYPTISELIIGLCDLLQTGEVTI